MRLSRTAVAALLLLLSITATASAQRLGWDASIGAGGGSWRAAVGGVWQLDLAGRLRLGAGARLIHFDGDSKSYRTHDSRPAALPARIPLSPEVWALNLAVSAELRLAGPIGAGANLDLAGIAAGPSCIVNGTRLSPARWSVFLYGDRDHGSLNSEFFVNVQATRRVALRAGASHFITGYKVSEGSTRPRYLRFDTVPFLAVRWTP